MLGCKASICGSCKCNSNSSWLAPVQQQPRKAQCAWGNFKAICFSLYIKWCVGSCGSAGSVGYSLIDKDQVCKTISKLARVSSGVSCAFIALTTTWSNTWASSWFVFSSCHATASFLHAPLLFCEVVGSTCNCKYVGWSPRICLGLILTYFFFSVSTFSLFLPTCHVLFCLPLVRLLTARYARTTDRDESQ